MEEAVFEFTLADIHYKIYENGKVTSEPIAEELKGAAITINRLKIYAARVSERNSKERKNWYMIDNTLLLIAAAICFK